MGANSYKEMVQRYSNVETIDSITEATPLFQTSIWEPTNNGYSHKYEELKSIIAAAAVNLNGSYPTVGADFNLKDRDIALFAGTREVHVNTVDQMAGGNLDAYLSKEMDAVYQQTLMNISYDFYYNLFRNYCKSVGKITSATTSPSGNKYSSVSIVRWQEGNFSGLVNDTVASSRGGVFTASPLSNGSRYKNSSGKSVYGVDIEMPVGFLPANKMNAQAVVNIDLSTTYGETLRRLLTQEMLKARAGQGGKTVAYASPALIAAMDLDSTGVKDNGLWTAVLNGIEFVGDYNLLDGTEAPFSIA